MTRYRISKETRTVTEMPAEDMPRESLERMGAEALSDEELMLLIIGSGISKRPVNEIAKELIAQCITLLQNNQEETRIQLDKIRQMRKFLS